MKMHACSLLVSEQRQRCRSWGHMLCCPLRALLCWAVFRRQGRGSKSWQQLPFVLNQIHLDNQCSAVRGGAANPGNSCNSFSMRSNLTIILKQPNSCMHPNSIVMQAIAYFMLFCCLCCLGACWLVLGKPTGMLLSQTATAASSSSPWTRPSSWIASTLSLARSRGTPSST